MGAATARQSPGPYRPDIDGLRALAVIAVIWFHSGLPGMPGGFTGVDVFFVISGYLITSIIVRDTGEQRFSFAYFYQRRFRRIAPALLTVTAATMAAGYALLLPFELDDLAKSAATAVGMSSNFYFWRTIDYFGLSGRILPLLHTWSLGVEEQFYLLFPAALVLAGRVGKVRLTIACLAVASFLLSVAAGGDWPTAAFYLLPTRGWELMIGASLAVSMVSVPERLREAGSVVGLLMILTGCVLLSDAVPFPGWAALLPTVGTALMIGGGATTLMARALSVGPVVYLGRISYSLYLWHWPIFIFLKHWRADLVLPPAWALGGVAAALLLSAASYRWIEQLARRRTTPFRWVLIPCLALAAAILAASAVAIAGRGLPERFPPLVNAMAEGRDAYAPLARTCLNLGADRSLKHCRFGPAGAPQVLLWGDSHASAISEAVGAGLGRPGVVVASGNCLPALDWLSKDANPACRGANDGALRLAEEDSSITTIVLSAHWAKYEEETGARFWPPVQRLIDRLNARGKKVVVVAGIPDPGIDIPWVSAIREQRGQPPLRLACPTANVPLHGVRLIDVSAGFCTRPAYLLFNDSNHPSRYAGLTVIAPEIRRAVR
jgi:peptidoglycan/LPS O-acetylase OafA/YrhL